jgi:hypothetical protein
VPSLFNGTEDLAGGRDVPARSEPVFEVVAELGLEDGGVATRRIVEQEATTHGASVATLRLNR